MFTALSPGRAFQALTLLIALGPAALAGPAHAMHGVGAKQTVRPKTVTFPGQIVSLSGPSSSPTGFILQTARRTIDFRTPATRFTARSAEALVDGFSANDFAIVRATRVNTSWVAIRVVYDVVPWGPIRTFTIAGTVQRVIRPANRLLVKMISGDTHWIFMNKNTKFDIAGQPVAGPSPLARDESVQIHVHRTAAGRWIALAISIVPAGTVT